MKTKICLLSSLIPLLLVGCGSGSNNDNDDTMSEIQPSFSLAISDAPVDNVLSVVACFSDIELRSDDSDLNTTFTIGDTEGAADANDMCTDDDGNVVANTRGIDLLAVSGSDSESLLSDITIGAGEYTQIRLEMTPYSYALVDLDGDGVADDEDGDGEADKVPVRVPSNELKLDGFTATVNQTLSFTLEFDLRKGMTDPVGQEGYILKPRGVRLVDNTEAGHIAGTVSETLLINNSCSVAPEDITTPVGYVYLYEGTELAIEDLADEGGAEAIEPVTSAPVYFDNVDTYAYEIGYVNSGDYTLALTCDAEADPEADDDISFIQTEEATVGSDLATTEVDFIETVEETAAE